MKKKLLYIVEYVVHYGLLLLADAAALVMQMSGEILHLSSQNAKCCIHVPVLGQSMANNKNSIAVHIYSKLGILSKGYRKR